MTAPAVSVCVPTYNRARYLGECLESILRQSFRDFELVVVDNASTDDTAAVVRRFADPRLRHVVNPENVGQIRNLNRCLELAGGEFVCLFHDDDVYDPRMLDRQLAVFAAHARVGLTHTAVWLLTGDGRVRKLHRVSPTDYVRPGRAAFVEYLAAAHDIVFSTVMVRRRCYEAVGPFVPGLLCADFDMWLRIALGWDIAYIAEPLAGYRIHAHTASQTMSALRWQEEWFEILDRAVRGAGDRVPELARLEPAVRERARRTLGRRSRVEAAARIADGAYGAARDFLAAARVDRSPAGTVGRWALAALRHPGGRAVLDGLRALRAWQAGREAARSGGEALLMRRYAETLRRPPANGHPAATASPETGTSAASTAR